jgi:hypothetical protein
MITRGKRHGYDGWALALPTVGGDLMPLSWSTCDTREKARELRRSRKELEARYHIVKVRYRIEVVHA